MPDPTGGLLTGAVLLGGSALSSGSQSRAANRATDAQTQSAQLAIDEQRRQFDEMRRLLAPYAAAGEPALAEMMNLAGLGGQGSQAAAFQQQEQSPLFQGLMQQGENAILQNASATGGLRGGNVQGALAQFRPQLLNQFIEQQYGRLGGLTQIGQNSAAGIGTAGMQTGQLVGQQYGNIGAAQAGGALARGQAQANMFGAPAQFLGLMGGLGKLF